MEDAQQYKRRSIEPAEEIASEYNRMKPELNAIRRKFLRAVRTNDEKGARAYSAALKDYRSIQVKLLLAMARLGVKATDDDLAKLLSDLPEVQCNDKKCKCPYHQMIRRLDEDSDIGKPSASTKVIEEQ